MKKDHIQAIIAVIGIITILSLIVIFSNSNKSAGYITSSSVSRVNSFNKPCPDMVKGNPNATFVIKYFYTKFCVTCWIENPILEKSVTEKGNFFTLEKYDANYCKEQTSKYQIPGVPSFVFSIKNETKDFTYFGFLSEEQLIGIICEGSGGC